MKKLYRKGTVHPSPSDSFSLSFLPAAILTLATALSADDREVLTYLLSCSAATLDFDPSKQRKKSHHPPASTCYCFSCYTSYWARWDNSPNRQRIHEIIDAYEDSLLDQRNNNRKLNRKNNSPTLDDNDDVVGTSSTTNIGPDRVNSEFNRVVSSEEADGHLSNGDDVVYDDDDVAETGERHGSVRKLVSFIGEKLWGGVWS